MIDALEQAARYALDGHTPSDAARRFGVDAVDLAHRLASEVSPDDTPTPLDLTPSEPKPPTIRASDTSDASDTALDEELLAGIRDGTWLDQQDFPPLRYAVPGLVPEGLTLLVGPPKAGKSWLILSTLLDVAAGGRILGSIPAGPPRRVLYLALEDGHRRMQDRSRRLLDDEPIPGAFSYLTTVAPGRLFSTIRAFLRRHPDTAMVVLDTLGKVMPQAGPGESAYQRDYRVGGDLKRITDERPGLALVVLHHDRKAVSEDFVDAVSGTNGLAGAADTIVVLSRKRQSTDGLLMVTGREVPEAEYALRLNGVSWQLDGDNLAEAAAVAHQRQESAGVSETTMGVVEFVYAAGPGGITAGAVAEKFGKDSYQYLKRQVDAGRLVKLGRGRYAAPNGPVSEASEVSEQQVIDDMGI